MDATQVWKNLLLTFHMSPRELYDNEEMDVLQRESIRAVMAMSRSEKRISLSHFVRDVMLSDESIAEGNGWTDVLTFLDWIDGGMD